MSLKRKASALPLGDAKKSKVNGSQSSIASFFSSPRTPAKASTTGVPTSSPPINTEADAIPVEQTEWKKKWVDKLTPEVKSLLVLEIESLDESWLKELKDEVTSPSFLELKRFLKKEHESGKKIFPPAIDVYAWYGSAALHFLKKIRNLTTSRSRHTPLNTVKAVIIGQDPYHNDNQAHGLCFSVRPPTNAPPSLVNIYKCLEIDYPSFVRPPGKSGLLTPWADRGVLLLNTCLTVRAHEANSHANRGWEKFTDKVIDTINKKRKQGVVFLAWGAPAGKRVAKVNEEVHCVLKSVHPSPLSASRGWFTCGHFKKTNEWLEKKYGPDGGIDWDLGVKVKTVAEARTEKAELAKKVEKIDVLGEAEVLEMAELLETAENEEGGEDSGAEDEAT